MVNKITTPLSENGTYNKINEIIDALGGGGGSVAIDNLTITENTNDEIQTVGVIDSRSGNALKLWSGTTSQVPSTTDATTLYFKTDDTNLSLSLLELLYPVGALYIGTMQTCPLQSLGIGTWQLVASDRVLQGAGTRGSVGSTVNESLPNITAGEYSADDAAASNFGASYTIRSGQDIAGAGGAGSIKGFDASRSSSAYQDNAPVQQDAYLVNIWERIS